MQTETRPPSAARSRFARSGQRPARWMRWLRWALVLVGGLVGALAVISGWGPLLLWVVALATAALGFYARRRRWWGLALCAAAVVVLVAVPSEVALRVQAIAAVSVFVGVALVWLAVHRRRLFRRLPGSQQAPHEATQAPGGPGLSDGRGLFGPRPLPTPGWRLVFVPILVCALVLVFALFGGWAAPGNQNLEAKWADWLRSHHAAGLASDIEKVYYEQNAPKKGGTISHLNAVPHARRLNPVAGKSPSTTAIANAFLPPPAAVPLVVQPGLPGEGHWAPTGPLVDGNAGLYVAQFRADTIYTSEITSAVWIDPKIVHVTLVPGSQEPGGTWPQPPYVPAASLPHLVGAFNGGFRTQDAHGGFYLDGRTEIPLVPGAASVVIYQDGHIDIGRWDTEVTMTPQVTAVLQNLVMIVDNGQPAPDATYNDASLWGSTLGSKTVVARSGIGVTADGALVYVAGPALTAKSLAESLQRAGAVRAMTLDLNPEWVTFNFYQPDPTAPDGVVGSKLYPQMQRSADRYLPPTHESRDFFMLTIDSPSP
jgi:hypothetical protein